MSKKKMSSHYNEFSGVSSVSIRTKIGTFEGISVLRQEDIDRGDGGNYFGCFCAELKAERKYIKELKKRKKIQLKILSSAYKNIVLTEENKKTPEMKRFSRMMKGFEKEIEDLNKKEKFLTDVLKTSIKQREEQIESFNKRRTQRSSKNIEGKII